MALYAGVWVEDKVWKMDRRATILILLSSVLLVALPAYPFLFGDLLSPWSFEPALVVDHDGTAETWAYPSILDMQLSFRALGASAIPACATLIFLAVQEDVRKVFAVASGAIWATVYCWTLQLDSPYVCGVNWAC